MVNRNNKNALHLMKGHNHRLEKHGKTCTTLLQFLHFMEYFTRFSHFKWERTPPNFAQQMEEVALVEGQHNITVAGCFPLTVSL